MDFTNLAAVEFVGAIEAERSVERRKRKWLIQWLDLRKAADARKAAAESTADQQAAHAA